MFSRNFGIGCHRYKKIVAERDIIIKTDVQNVIKVGMRVGKRDNWTNLREIRQILVSVVQIHIK